jgi:hypothetical protein
MSEACPSNRPHHDDPGRPSASVRLGAVVAVLAVVAFGVLGAIAPTPNRAGGATPAPRTPSVSAYWVVASDGGIFSFGGAGFYGSTGGVRLNKPMVGMTGTPDSLGYWEVASDGGIFTYGDAPFYGSTGNLTLNRPVVGMARTADGHGYWLVASDGGIFAYGDAGFYGSAGNLTLNRPVVGMAATPDGRGYWLVASDGGVFAYGDAQFYGSTGNLRLNQPIVGITPTHDGHGYWFTAADGGVFAYGDAPFYGSLGNVPQHRPIVSITADASGQGYWFTNSNGGVSAFGSATYWGSTPQVLNQPVVGMAQAAGSGRFTGSSYPSGSFGYDISYAQCAPGGLPPSPHTIGIVQVEQPGHINPCLAQEAAWAGGGLNLYIFMVYGNATSSGDPACNTASDPSTCNYGFNSTTQAYRDALAAGINTSVAWWLDVEGYSLPGVPSWSPSTPSNMSLVQGAIDGLKSEGLNSVGIYASPGVWPNIVGNYTPPVPYWAADWQLDPGTTCTDIRSKYADLPSGPVQIVQYSSPGSRFQLGGMSLAFDNDFAC